MTAVAIIAALLLPGLLWRWWRKRDTSHLNPTKRRSRRVVFLVAAIMGMQTLMGAPAFAAPTDCAPTPEDPDGGVVGVLDPAAALGLHGDPGSVYFDYRYAGQTWNYFDPNCGSISSLGSPTAQIDTWIGNKVFNVAKVIVAATNGLHYAITGNLLVGPLDHLVGDGSKALYNGVFTPLLGLAALGLGILLFRHIWRGDLAAISRRGLWALAGLWLASATYLTPLVYTQVLNDALITSTVDLQNGFLGQVGLGDDNNSVSTMLHQNVVYENWLRGEFGGEDIGTSSSPQAKQFGKDLVAAQAFSIDEKNQGKDADPNNVNAKKQNNVNAKKQQFVDISTKLGTATDTFKGTTGSRTGVGFLAVLQAIVFSLFQLMANAAILLAQVLLRFIVLAGPLLGLIAIVFPDFLRKVGQAAGSALFNVVIISALAGLDTLVLSWIFSPSSGLDLLPQMLLAGLATVVLFLVGKPGKRMLQMVQLSTNMLGERGRFLDRLLKRKSPDKSQSAWEEAERINNGEQTVMRRERPEGYATIYAEARRVYAHGSGKQPTQVEPRQLPGGGANQVAPVENTPALPAGSAQSDTEEAVPAVVSGSVLATRDVVYTPGNDKPAQREAIPVIRREPVYVPSENRSVSSARI